MTPSSTESKSDLVRRLSRLFASYEQDATKTRLGRRCPESQRRLFLFAIQCYGWPDLGPIAEKDLRRHAELLYSNAQAELRAAGPRLERLAAFELAAGIELARKALVHLEGKVGAKRIEIDIADGAPLTICMGSRKPMKLKVEPVLFKEFDTDGEEVDVLLKPKISPYGSGCFAVIPDRNTSAGGRQLWTMWCKPCSPNGSGRSRRLMDKHARILEANGLVRRVPR